ncbi:MAG: DUF3015 family protein, partial [Nitrospinota bacterium]
LFWQKKEQQIFVEENFFSLAKEMASGKGETLETFASLLGCSPESHGEFGTFTKHHYGTLFQNEKTTAIELIDAVQKEIPKDEKLSASCTSIQI